MFHDGFHIDNRADTCGQTVVNEGRRIGLVRHHRHGITIECDLLIDVFRRETELLDDEGGRLVQLDHPAQRIGRIFCGQRVAR